MVSFERLFQKNGFRRIAGVDEVGRGPLAGPVVACAVMFPPFSPLFDTEVIRDSKSLTQKMRERKYWEILKSASIGIGVVTPQEIDQLNILNASLFAMKKAVLSLGRTPEVALIDGLHTIDGLQMEQVPIVEGDCKAISIASASIIAKVTRDKMMEVLDHQYPHYGFVRHKGYPTREHLSALSQHGPSPIHRMSFDPVSKSLKINNL